MGPRRKTIALLFGLLAAGALVTAAHWPVLSAQALSLDDQQFVLDNRLVQNPSWASAKRFLTEVLQPSTVAGYYLPLSMISLMADCAMGGRTDDFRAFHRTSLTLHVANTTLIILLLYSLFGQPLPAVLTGVLFGLHPLVVEPVAWVGERKTLLAAFFTLAALLAYVRHAHGSGRVWLVASVALYVLALLSKPTALPVPALLLLMDYWPLNRLRWRSLPEKLPFFVIAAPFGVVTLISHARTAGIAAASQSFTVETPLLMCHLVVFYLGKIIWPVRLCSVYPTPAPLSLSNPVILLGVAGTATLIVVLLISLRWTRALLAGAIIFFVAILPTLGLVQYSWVTASDKYVYLPAVGLLMLLAWALGGLWQAGARQSRMATAGLLATILILAAAEARAARQYLRQWRDSMSLAEYMLACAPDCAQSHDHLGSVLALHGQVDEATGHFREALRLQPVYAEANYNLGVALRMKGQAADAVGYLRSAVAENPRNAYAYANLGLVLGALRQRDDAIEQFRTAARLLPDDPDVPYYLGRVLQSAGQRDAAIEQFRQALRLNPGSADAECELGAALAAEGKRDEAVRHFRRAVEINPDHVEARINLGTLLAVAGRFDEALEHLRRALAIRPRHPQALYNLGLALQYQGHLDEAISSYGQALEVRPDYAEAQNALGRALVEQGSSEQAVAHFEAAARLKPDWLTPLNAAAWIRATHPDANAREAQWAVQMAERAAELSGRRSAGVLDTLAAAYAATGQFDRAIRVAEEAQSLAVNARDNELAKTLSRRLELYRQRQPYREPASAPASAPPP